MSALEQSVVSRRSHQASLRPVALPRTARAWPRGSFPVVILVLLGVGMVGHLLLQTKIQAQGFELATLQTEASQLAAQQSILQATLDRQSTPLMLAYSASQLGMVANPYTTFVVLPTGEIRGTGEPAWGHEVPVVSAPPDMPQPKGPVDPLEAATEPLATPDPDPQAGDQA